MKKIYDDPEAKKVIIFALKRLKATCEGNLKHSPRNEFAPRFRYYRDMSTKLLKELDKDATSIL